MKILTDAGRNKHGQRLVRVECSCGNIFEAIYNNVKRGRTKTCGHCGQPNPNSIPAPVTAQESESTFERGTPAWYQEQIACKLAAAITLEKQATELEQIMKLSGIQQQAPGLEPPDKLWNRATTTACKLRAEIARLMSAKDKAETSTLKDARTQAEIVKDKINALSRKQ